MRTLTIETNEKVGQEVVLKGWINNRRNMGKIVFLDLRDREGIVQVVGVPSELDEKSQEELVRVRPEWVVEIRGIVNSRGSKQQNPEMPTGMVEVLAKEIKVYSEAQTPPFEIVKDTKIISEELRLKYRYLDLRSERMAKNLRARHVMNKFLRDYLSDNGFWEVETPYVTKGTPEGAREFIIPSRLHKGEFYVLPQSPQQFKQLLMVAGVEKYFQIARCFRDEDQRGDRQPEFTQLDIETSFLSQEDILSIMEKMIIELVENNFSNLHISQKPFPVLSYQEAMEKYNSDKPDLRKDKNDKTELAFCWVVDFPLFEKNEDGSLSSSHHPFTRPKDEDLSMLDSNPEKVRSCAYDLALNGFEVGGGSLRIFDHALQKKIFQILGVNDEDINVRFGHILEAFTYGVPPHGGIAFGIDRLIALFQGEENIREVIAFPKTSDAKDLMMGAPSSLPDSSLSDANIRIR